MAMLIKARLRKYLALSLTFVIVFSLFSSISTPGVAADSEITYEINNPGAASTASGVTVNKTVSEPIFSGSDIFFDITLEVTDTHSVETILNEATYVLTRDGGGNFNYTLYKTKEELKAAAALNNLKENEYTIYPITFQFVDRASAHPNRILYEKTVYVHNKMDGWMNGNAFVGFQYGNGEWLRSDAGKIANRYFKVDISTDEYYLDMFHGTLALSLSDAVADGFSFVSIQSGYNGTVVEDGGNITWTLGTQNSNVYTMTYRVKMTTAQEAVYPVGSAMVTYKDFSQGQNPTEQFLVSKIPAVEIIYPRYSYMARYWFEVAEGTTGAQNINDSYYVQYLGNYPNTIGVTKFLKGTTVTSSNIDSNVVKTISGYTLSNNDFSMTISATESSNVIDLYYNKSVSLTVKFENQNSDTIKSPVVYSDLKVCSSTDFSGIIANRLTGTDQIEYKLNWNGQTTFAVDTTTTDTTVIVTYIPLATYTVDYKFNAPSPEGVTPPAAQSYDEDNNTLQLPSVTTPTGWRFKGWADHINGEKINSSFTVYGNWVQLFDLDVLYVFETPETKAAYNDALASEYAKYDEDAIQMQLAESARDAALAAAQSAWEADPINAEVPFDSVAWLEEHTSDYQAADYADEARSYIQNQVKSAGFFIDANADSFSECIMSQAENGTAYSVPAKAIPAGFAVKELSPTAGTLSGDKTITYTIVFGEAATATAKYWVEVLPGESPDSGTVTGTYGNKTYKLVDTISDGRIYGTYSFTSFNDNLPAGTEYIGADGKLTGTLGTQSITINLYYDFKRFHVAFEFSNEGPEDVIEPTDVTVIYGRTVSDPDIGKTGWVFDGWYNGQSLYSFSQPVTDDLTLNGSWQQVEYRVVYSATGNPDYTAPVDSATYHYGDTITVKDVGEYNTSEYTFSGWTPNTDTISVIAENIGADNTIYITGTFTPVAKYTYYVQYYYNGVVYGEPVQGLTPMNAGYEFSTANENLSQFDTNPKESESSDKQYTLDRIDGITISAEGDNTIKVFYVSKMYQLTIHYVNAAGETLATDYTDTLPAGSPYSVTSPTISGYTPDQVVVSGTLNQDTEITVNYTYIVVPPVDDPEIPPVEPPEENPSDETIDIPEEEVPLGPPDETEIPEQELPQAGGLGMETLGFIGAGSAIFGLILGRKKKDENNKENGGK